LFAQIFADALALPLSVSQTEEAAAWGAALCAGAGVGRYAAATADPRDLTTLARRYIPNPETSANLQTRYALHCAIAESLTPLWPQIEALADAT